MLRVTVRTSDFGNVVWHELEARGIDLNAGRKLTTRIRAFYQQYAHDPNETISGDEEKVGNAIAQFIFCRKGAAGIRRLVFAV